ASAEALANQAVEIIRKALGETHPDYALALSNLASFYEATGQYAKALEISRRASTILKQTVGEDHPKLVGILIINADLLAALSQNGEPHATRCTRRRMNRRIFGRKPASDGSAENSPSNASRRNSRQRLACDGRRSSLSHGESFRSHNRDCGRSQAHSSTRVYHHVIRFQAPTVAHT